MVHSTQEIINCIWRLEDKKKQRQYQCVLQVRECFLGFVSDLFQMVQSLLSTGFVSETPVFNLNENSSTITCETVSLVPANYIWMSCSSSNDRYDYSQRG